MVWVTVSMVAALVIGVLARVNIPTAYPNQSAAESAFIDQARLYFPVFLAGVFLCAVLASSMSTADSQLLVASSAFSEDLYHTFIHPKASDGEILFVSRVSIIAITIIAIFLALDPNSSVFYIVSYAWAGFGATFGPAILASIFWKGTSRQGVIAGMLAGGVTVIVWKQLQGGIFSLYELLPGFLVATFFLVVCSLVWKPNQETKDGYDAYLEALKADN